VPLSLPIATSTPKETALLFATSTSNREITLDKDGVLLKRQDVADRQDRATTTMLLKNVHSFDVFNSRIVAVDWNGFAAYIDFETGQIRTVGRTGLLLVKNRPLRMASSPNDEVAIMDSAGGVILIDDNENMIPLTGGVKNLQFDARGDKLLLQKDGSIEVVWRRDNKYQPFQREGVQETILTLRSTVHDAQWFYGDNAHVVFRTDEGIYMTELDGRGGRNTAELVSGKTDGLITRPELPNAVFFKKGNGYFKIEL